MKKIYTILLFLLTGITNNYGQDKEIYDDVNVYTDQTRKIIKIVYSSTERMEIQINVLNELGQTVYSSVKTEGKGIHNKIIDLGKEPKGTYTIEIENEKLKQVEQIDFN